MKLFGKKDKPAAPPPIVPPQAPPPAPEPPKPDPKLDESSLKLDLPNIFEYDKDETKAKRGSSAARADEEAAPNRGTVILVESDEEVSRLISRLLQHEGLHVARVTCLAEAQTTLKDLVADHLLARRHCVPVNLQTENILRDLQSKTSVRIVDDFNELLLGQVIDYESMAQSSLGMADLLMSLLEGANVGVRGHAHSVSKYSRLVGQRLGFSRRELDAVTIAGLLHDLGGLETNRQLGAPLHARSDALAQTIRTTTDMLANTPFPYEVRDLITLAANLPPVEGAAPVNERLLRLANILRVADAYDSLRRAAAGAPKDDEIFDQMRRQPTGVFDPDVLETFIQLRKGEQAISAMNIFWAGILIVDAHPEDQQLLRMRLENDDFHVMPAKSVEEALQILRKENITLVVSENKLVGQANGFELLRTMRSDTALQHIPFVFHAPADTDLVRQALEEGAEDWLTKPHNIEIMAMKLQRIVARRHTGKDAGKGVRGNLREMGIIEMVQILNSGSRSVQITLENPPHTGELILQQGQIVAATCGKQTGEVAALELLTWEAGQFRIAPLRQPAVVSMRTSADNLLHQCYALKEKKKAAENTGAR